MQEVSDMKGTLLKLVDDFSNKKIMVIGDLMLDKYIWGDVSRVSPEAPVQVVNVSKENYAPGGAANVANNVAALNAGVFMVGVVGDDHAQKILLDELEERKINVDGIVSMHDRPTVQKIRVMARGQQLLRVDYEDHSYVNGDVAGQMLDFIKKSINDIDAIVVSDYAKGVITKEFMDSLGKLVQQFNKILVIDPKPKNTFFYRNATVVTPNHKEAAEMAREEERNDDGITRIGNKLVKMMKSNVLITRGEHGMSLFEKQGKITNIKTRAREVYDVTGAGDTVVATVALALAAGAELKEAAALANYAAGVVVAKVGTSTMVVDELKAAIKDD